MAGESGGHLGCAWRACVTPLGLGALERQQCLCSVKGRCWKGGVEMGRVWGVLSRGRWGEGKSVGGAGDGERGREWEVLGRGG